MWFAVFVSAPTVDILLPDATVVLVFLIFRLAKTCGKLPFNPGPTFAQARSPSVNIDLHVISVLADDTAGKEDLYIRSVCFSPDGKYLATGAEDKQIRVRAFDLMVMKSQMRDRCFYC